MIRRIAALLLLLPAGIALAQQQQAATNTSLTASSPTLQLPGSLTLTSIVTPAPTSPGLPTGTVQFQYDGTGALGTGPLTLVPGTENFLAPAATGTLATQPIGIFTLKSASSSDSVLGVLDWYTPTAPGTATPGVPEPQLTIYSGHGTSLFQTATPYPIPNSGFTNNQYSLVDAFAVADFNHDGIPDVLLHGYTGETWQYYLLPGASGGSYDPTAGTVIPDTSGLSCQYCNPASVIATDDFNGDGYPDIALAGYYAAGPVGVALNAGASAPGTFQNFVAAPAVNANGVAFAPLAITSGHFTSSGHADLAVAGYFMNSSGVSATPGAVALYLGNGDGTFQAPVLTQVGVNPEGIATADFRKTGLTDVVVANTGSENNDASIEVLFGDGNGGLTESSIVAMTAFPESVEVADFNGDGYPDILAECTDGSLHLLLNDGTGHFSSSIAVGTAAGVRSHTAIGDFNSDTLPDIAQLTLAPPADTTTLSSAFEYVNSATARASLITGPQTLPAGAHSLTAIYPGNVNFLTSTSPGQPVTVTQTTPVVTWPAAAAIEYGTPLSGTQLDATASVPGSFAYQPPAGTILPPGSTTVTATFAPTDSFDYSAASASQPISVGAPSLIGIAPSTAVLGAAGTTITVSGQGFLQGAQVAWNGAALATTWVSLNQLTAVVPASLLASIGTGSITVRDPAGVAVSGSATFTITASPAVAQSSAPATTAAGQNSSVTLTVSPYPIAITATLTLNFAPISPGVPTDPSVLFPNNSTNETISIPANSSTAIPPIVFSVGSTAGTVTLTITLNAGGANVTPASLVPIVITVPSSPPTINSVTLTRSGTTLTVAMLGLSATRDMTQAHFHFTAAAGQSLKTTDITVPLSTAFTTWYQSSQSDSFGTAFLYTQPFTLDSDASTVGSVTVTLTNSQGDSQPGTAQ